MLRGPWKLWSSPEWQQLKKLLIKKKKKKYIYFSLVWFTAPDMSGSELAAVSNRTTSPWSGQYYPRSHFSFVQCCYHPHQLLRYQNNTVLLVISNKPLHSYDSFFLLLFTLWLHAHLASFKKFSFITLEGYRCSFSLSFSTTFALQTDEAKHSRTGRRCRAPWQSWWWPLSSL